MIKFSLEMLEADEPDNQEFLVVKMDDDDEITYVVCFLPDDGLWLIEESIIDGNGIVINTQCIASIVGVDGI